MKYQNPPLEQHLINEKIPSHDFALGEILWNYHNIQQPLVKADAIFVLGSNDLRVPTYASHLFLEGWADWLIFSGGLGNFTKGFFEEAEGDYFRKVALDLGVPDEKIIVENKASNSGENVEFTKKILHDRNIKVSKIIATQKPFMLRRAFATLQKKWPEINLTMAAPNLTLSTYPFGPISLRYTIEIMVGDLERIIRYPAMGFQTYQEIPQNVQVAYEELIQKGYTGHMMK